MTGRTHIVGAGLAGLSAAVRLAERGREIAIWEATAQAGGRCRTFWDPRLERFVDNGNHLVLSGNRSVRAYLQTIGAAEKLITAPEATFSFFDADSGERWGVSINDGRIPWWVFRKDRRIPGTGVMDYLSGFGLARAGKSKTVAETIRKRGLIWDRFWEPLTLAVMNTTPNRAAAVPLWRAIAETFVQGGAKCRPMFAPDGLGRALIDPAISWLADRSISPSFDHALKAVDIEEDVVTALTFTNGHRIALGPQDDVLLALPPARLKPVLPWLDVPVDDAAILNAHFTLGDPTLLNGCAPITGLINAKSHWVFVRGDVVSLTISAADRLGVMDQAPADLIPELWAEAARALNLGDTTFVAARINKERRATFDQSPEGVARRPDARTPIKNLVLAGDSTRTGLPATIEGAVRSGETGARLLARESR